jgi:c-di-GMP-binding flagellar brake protein YcgR
MFRTGGSYKVKIQLPDGDVGFGRAAIEDMEGTKLYVTFNSRGERKHALPNGTKIWMVGDSADSAFNGLWTTTVSGEKIVKGHNTLECSSPKFTPIVQRRRFPRYPLNCPVWVSSDGAGGGLREVQALDVSRSGIALIGETGTLDNLKIDEYIHCNIDSPTGYMSVICRVVRNTNNWLTNQTEVGLEFARLDNDAIDCLDRLMASVENAPVDRTRKQGDITVATPLGLSGSGWIKGSRTDKSLLLPPSKDKNAHDQRQTFTKNLRALQSKVDEEKKS